MAIFGVCRSQSPPASSLSVHDEAQRRPVWRRPAGRSPSYCLTVLFHVSLRGELFLLMEWVWVVLLEERIPLQAQLVWFISAGVELQMWVQAQCLRVRWPPVPVVVM